MSARKPTIGLTGGIASGKSSAVRVLRALGVLVVDADQLAREVVEPGSEGLREVVAAFGEGVLAADGSLDRERLAAVVFGDEAARKRLQGITHPRIGRLSAERIAQGLASEAPYVVYDAPLLVEVGGAVLVVSQFTLYGDLRKGRRPSFDDAAEPVLACALYERVCAALVGRGLIVQTGRFGAMMRVDGAVDGPVTILIDSERQF